MKTALYSLLAVLTVGLASCSSGPNAQTGTVLGALGGAAAGGIIGHQSGRGLEGAAIGAGLGGLGGNMIGGAQDQRNYERREYYRRGDGYGGYGGGYGGY
ncbi:glycine zipper domain-containing protein [Verrucomicrobium spinosum]|uniref:glycine zipper domain-containing protein n=1 Tax=Verrucomicrobium spinosum TaxID=2736 RepID=UPI000174631F|nr:glycine zipper domain-containing protein [Verrucomicrobium spinosum]